MASPNAPAPADLDPRRRDQEKRRASLPEWLAAALGALLVLASLAVLGWQARHGEHRPPAPRIEVQGVEQTSPGQWLVRARVHNDGEQTAADLRIAGELRQGGQTLERSEARIDYLPPHAVRSAGLFFTRDPAGFELRLRAEGYQKP